MSFDPEFDGYFQYILIQVGFTSAIISVVLILLLVCLKYRILNRMTLRFQALIAVLDVIRYWSYSGFGSPDGALCTFVGFMIYFNDHLYVFLNVMIALNVQLLYIHDIRPKKSFERFYLVGSFGLAFLIGLIPLIDNAYGKNIQTVCALKQDHVNKGVYQVLLTYVISIPGVIYCLVSFIMVCFFIKSKLSKLESRYPNRTIRIYGENVDSQLLVENLFFRMSLYPVSCFISMFPYLFANFLYDSFNLNYQLTYFLARAGRGSVGLLNLLSLLYDPHLQIALANLWNRSPLHKLYKFNFLKRQTVAHQLDTVVEANDNISPDANDEVEVEGDKESNLLVTDFIRYC